MCSQQHESERTTCTLRRDRPGHTRPQLCCSRVADAVRSAASALRLRAPTATAPSGRNTIHRSRIDRRRHVGAATPPPPPTPRSTVHRDGICASPRCQTPSRFILTPGCLSSGVSPASYQTQYDQDSGPTARARRRLGRACGGGAGPPLPCGLGGMALVPCPWAVMGGPGGADK